MKAVKKESRPKKSGSGIQLFVNPKVKMSLRILHRIVEKNIHCFVDSKI